VVRLPLAQATYVQKQHSRSLTARSSELCSETIWARSLEVRLELA